YNERYHHVKKVDKTQMIDNVQHLLATGRFYYLDIPENEIFIKQHQKYQWDEKTVNTDDPKVIKVDDHTCDQFQYFVLDNLRDLDLKW
ncbi:terminase large subunit, partial [Lactiplantibacillus plantarum]|nr:terminase large subunit [Lactiplantibacillus plantarum]